MELEASYVEVFTAPMPSFGNLEIHGEAKGGQGINLDERHVMIDLGQLGLHVALHDRVGAGIDADRGGNRASGALQSQRRLGRPRVSHPPVRNEGEWPAVA